MDKNWLFNTEQMLGKNSIAKLKKSKVAIFGCGGVGSYTIDNLVRAGIGNIVLIDKAVIDLTNLNRNLMADTKVVGKYKIDVARKRLLDINPNLNITTIKEYLSKENTSELVSDDYDYIIDTIDSVHDKINLIKEATHRGIPIISSMGTSDKFDPTMFEITDISKTESCPFATLLKEELEKIGIKHLKVIYSKEQPPRFRNSETNRISSASISFVPSVVGSIISSEVIKDLIN